MDGGTNPREHTTDGADLPQWETGMEDESSGVMKLVGRQIKVWREAAGLTQAEFGSAIGYGEEMVSKVERGIRIPKAEFLDNADRVLKAGGKLASLKPEAAEARYPKKVRDLAKLEADAIEMGAPTATTTCLASFRRSSMRGASSRCGKPGVWSRRRSTAWSRRG